MDMEQRISGCMDRKLKDARHKLEIYITKLEGLSPLTKLKKGYAMVRGADGKPVQSVGNVKKDDLLTITLIDGDIVSRVEDKKEINRKAINRIWRLNGEKEFKLEEAFERLNNIIEELEKPDISLEQSFALYQEGMKLLKESNASIDKVEKELIILSENGETDEL